MENDMTKAAQVVTTMLENNPLDPDRYDKFDRARKSATDLRNLRKKVLEIDQQIGRCIDYERMLAYHGLRREDVETPITGDNVGATDSYKHSVPAKICRNQRCSFGGGGGLFSNGHKAKYQPAELEICPGCQEPLETVMKPTLPSDLRGKFAKHLVGVKLKDGRKVMFKEMVLPVHMY